MLNLIDRDVFGDNVTKFMTEALISHNLLLKTQMYYGDWKDMTFLQLETEQFEGELIVGEQTESEDRESYIERFWNGQLGITQTLRGYPETVPLSGNFV